MAKGLKKHVLIVDDEYHFRFGVSVALRMAGYRTTEACNGREALGILRGGRGRIDLIVVNLQMPVMDGVELIEELYREEVRIPIIAVSGAPDIQFCRNDVDLLIKPFGPEELVRKVREILK